MIFDPNASIWLVFIIATMISWVVYFLPTIISFIGRKHPDRWVILMVNIFMGWTFIGWVILMIYTMKVG